MCGGGGRGGRGVKGAGMNVQSTDCRDKQKLIHSVCVVTQSYIAT